MDVFGIGADTLLMSYCLERDILKSRAKACPADLQVVLEVWSLFIFCLLLYKVSNDPHKYLHIHMNTSSFYLYFKSFIFVRTKYLFNFKEF